MPRQICLLLTSVIAVAAAQFTVAADFDAARDANWHQWRGPNATGVAVSGNPPITWSEDENLRWAVDVEGLGNSTPIIWGDQVFLITAIDSGKAKPGLPAPEDQPKRPFGIKYPNTFHQFVVLCLNRTTGDELWRKTAVEAVPQEGHHGDNSHATASPTTDGERLYAWFGSAGLYCFDMEGNAQWQRDLGPAKTRLSFGEGASPVVYGDRLIVVRDHDRQSTITVMDSQSGEIVWQKERDESSGWATPLVIEYQGTTQIVTNGKKRVRSYDLSNGDLIWECGGQVSNVTPSPVATDDVVYCMSGYRGSAVYALPLEAKGDITDSSSILWQQNKGTPYVPSPLLYQGQLYFTQSNQSILTSLDAASGDAKIERSRVSAIRGLYASPVAADGRVYLIGRRGTSVVLEHGSELKVLATNKLDDRFDASPAIAGDQLFLRGKQRLYCLAADQ